ncbi:MAG: DNA polymerase III subunit delta [Candidatus Dadabacteria bacterium]|nr:DNA polymerase III subunit delta [Candidatus Dadabacteria bacterium]NIQ16031.1 DNA polymerase III subunit delta [Candidatus Dadabacteria bacterium]
MKLKPISILKSNQPISINEFINDIKEKISKNLYQSTFDYEDTPFIDIIEEANSLPMFFDKKLITVKNFNDKNKSDIELLNNYCEKPSAFSNIVLITTSDQKTQKIGSFKNTEVINLDSSTNFKSKVKNESQKLGIQLTTKAINALIGNLGEDLILIKNELQKISLYTKNKKTLDEKDILEFVNNIIYKDTFSLITSLSNRELKNSIKILKELEKKQEDPISILHLITWRVRQIFKMLELKKMNLKNEEIAKILKTSKGAVYYLEKSARNFKIGEMEKILERLHYTDFKLKNTSTDKYLIINRLVSEICSN